MDQVVSEFSGEYDIASRDRLRSTLQGLSDAPGLTLDFRNVTYIDSTVVTELVRLHNARNAKGYPTETILVQNDNVKRIFTVLSLDAMFHVVDRRDGTPAEGEHPTQAVL